MALRPRTLATRGQGVMLACVAKAADLWVAPLVLAWVRRNWMKLQDRAEED